jgi:pimeloyl-ACP methyl ester carboxylesterase
LYEHEKALSLHEDPLPKFHSLLYYPNGHGLTVPGYIVALEKAPQEKIGGPRDVPAAKDIFNARADYFQGEKSDRPFGFKTTRELLQKAQNDDSKAIFVSHVMRYGSPSGGAVGAADETALRLNDRCFVYNVFAADFFHSGKEGMPSTPLGEYNRYPFCSSVPESHRRPADDKSIYGNGLVVMEELQNNILADLRGAAARKTPYSHLLVIVMGWNTPQEEAIRNFNDISRNIQLAAHEPGQGAGFRPLTIGITWPSMWTYSFWNAFSYPNKANDADEIGLTWLNLVVNHVLINVEQQFPALRTVLVGHSFGGRVASRALFSSPALQVVDTHGGRRADQEPRTAVDLLVVLEGAVSINRFGMREGREGSPYRDHRPLPAEIVLTSSKNDKAEGRHVFWYDPAGSHKSYQRACEDSDDTWHDNAFDCNVARFERGKYSVEKPFAREKRIRYFDVSVGITAYNTEGTGGKAHSDVYRYPMGVFLWDMIGRFAPGQTAATAAAR